tara:strand:+ start:672 stop:2273 length:1602 start_codon:yes stop_codon:yes gene_type:complete
MEQKKIKTKILFTILLIATISFVLAGNLDTIYFKDKSTGNSLTGVDFLLHTCSDSVCSSIISLVQNLNSGSNNYVNYEYSSTDRLNYGAYMFKSCYLPHEDGYENFGNGGNFEVTYELEKAPSCHSPIDSFSVTNSNYVNEPVVVNVQAVLGADAHSAFTNAELTYVPSGYEDYYSAETKITLEMLDISGNVVYTESKTYEILQDTSQNVQFTWTPSSNGNYTARVKTDVIDCQCQSSFEQFSEKNFIVWEARPQNECYTIVNDLEAVPEFADEGEEVIVTFNKISNYADENYTKTTISTRATYEITDNQNNVVYSDSVLLNANANEIDSEETSFTWTPNFGGNFNVKVTGIGESSLCDGKTNPADIAILGFFTSSTPTYEVVFLVSDSETNEMLNGVDVNFGSQNRATDSAGRVVFTSNPGSYSWDVSLSGYDSETGTADVTGNTTINVNLDPVEEDDDSGGSSSRRSGSGGTTKLHFPVLSAFPSDVFVPTTIIDTSEEEPESISGLIWILIAEVLIVLGIILFLLKKKFY